ncbi:MAG TPA: PilZ domain-containing protein [Candidatus Acidoferrales bacterium]
MKAAERRTNPRTKLVEIAYIGMGPENGGLVLDVSDGGLSFQSVAPVHPAEKIKFLLSLRGHSRIEGVGEVVWTNGVGTVCGMKFASLSVGALEYLNNWTNQSRTAPPAKPAGPPAADREKAVVQEAEPELVAEVEPEVELGVEAKVEPDPRIEQAAAPTDVEENVPSAAHISAFTPAIEARRPELTALSPRRNPVFFWPVVGLVAAAIPIAAFLFGVRIGKSQYKSPAQAGSEHGSQSSPAIVSNPITPDLPHAGGAQASPENMPSSAIPQTPTPSGQIENAPKAADISGNAIKPAAKAITQPAKQKSDDGNSDLTAALAQLNGDNGTRNSSTAVRLLWTAVSKGNTTAAVTLADLYVNGDGVEKNCEQGKTLLTSASNKGNGEAKVKLDEINAEGCP